MLENKRVIMSTNDKIDVFGVLTKSEEYISAINFGYSQFDDKVQLLLGEDFEIMEEDGNTYVVRKLSKYPKTYEECCEVLGISVTSISEVEYEKYTENLYSLYQLLVCRDAYWTILGGWEPSPHENVYNIFTVMGKVRYGYDYGRSNILEFPTEELNRAFYKNFKGLIQECKELL